MRRAALFMVIFLMASGLTSRALAQAERQIFITHEMNSQDLDTAELQAFDQTHERQSHDGAAARRQSASRQQRGLSHALA